METCDQSLATESFSYSWSLNKSPSFDDLDEYLRSSSPRDTNFNFDTSISKSSSLNLAHADEIFCNGHIMPKYVERSKKEEALSSSVSVPSIPFSPFSSRTIYQEDSSTYRPFLKKWRKSSKQLLQKVFGVFSRPFCQKVGLGCARKSIRVDDMNRKVREVQSQGSSLQASPQQINKKINYRRLRKVKSWTNLPREYVPQSPSCSINVFCDIESSISEAVLYCKRTIEN